MLAKKSKSFLKVTDSILIISYVVSVFFFRNWNYWKIFLIQEPQLEVSTFLHFFVFQDNRLTSYLIKNSKYIKSSWLLFNHFNFSSFHNLRNCSLCEILPLSTIVQYFLQFALLVEIYKKSKLNRYSKLSHCGPCRIRYGMC